MGFSLGFVGGGGGIVRVLGLVLGGLRYYRSFLSLVGGVGGVVVGFLRGFLVVLVGDGVEL